MKSIGKHGCAVSFATALIFSLGTQAATCSGGGEYSNWMERVYADNGRTRLRDIAIPGTHEAGTFSIHSIDAVNAISVAQSRDLCLQAKDGIRYFELSIRNDAVKNQFNIVHDMISGAELPKVLNPLLAFAQNHPKEIIILDFKEMNDFANETDVQRFNAYFLTEFADRLIPRISYTAANLRMADSWKLDRNIIALAGNQLIHDSSNYYWHRGDSIDSPATNAATVKELKRHQDTQIVTHQNTNKFYVSQMQLTFMGFGNIISTFNNLKSLADEANTYLSQWMLAYEFDQGLMPNIIIVDYYERRSKVVETSIALNQHRIEPASRACFVGRH